MGAGANETGLDDMRTQVVSVSAAAGGKLRALVESGDGRVAAYYKRFSRLDPWRVSRAHQMHPRSTSGRDRWTNPLPSASVSACA